MFFVTAARPFGSSFFSCPCLRSSRLISWFGGWWHSRFQRVSRPNFYEARSSLLVWRSASTPSTGHPVCSTYDSSSSGEPLVCFHILTSRSIVYNPEAVAQVSSPRPVHRDAPAETRFLLSIVRYRSYLFASFASCCTGYDSGVDSEFQDQELRGERHEPVRKSVRGLGERKKLVSWVSLFPRALTSVGTPSEPGKLWESVGNIHF